jgi:hypothetical protein
MKNDLGNKTRRRKVALTVRERNLQQHTQELADFDNGQVGLAVGNADEKNNATLKELSKSLADSMKAAIKGRIELAKAEIETLKKLIGGYHD